MTSTKGETSLEGEALASPPPADAPTTAPGRYGVIALRAKRTVQVILALGLAFVTFVYTNGIVTRLTNVHDLPFHNGQSFCIVGNGPGVGEDPGYGAFIDSHDVVVRFNTVVTHPANHTGRRTDLHVITAGSPKQHLPGSFSIVVYSSWIHDKLAEWAHPFTFPLHARFAQFQEDTGTVGPSSGLLITKFLSEVYPASRISTIGMGEFTANNMSGDKLHYFNKKEGDFSDRWLWTIESKYGLHHNNETGMFANLRSSHRNVETVQMQVAAGAKRAPRLANASAGAAARALNASRRGDPNSGLRRALRSDGYQLVSGVLSREDAQQMRDEMLTRRKYIEKSPLKRFFHRIVNPTGLETVDFMHRNRAWYAASSWLSFTPSVLEQKLKPYLEQHFGGDDEVDWFFHNDAGINHLSRWHKDRLNNNLLGRYRDDYEGLDPWDTGDDPYSYHIYKCLIYLQDHGGPHGLGPALDVIPGSHLAAPAGEGGVFDDLAPQNESVIAPVAPTMGDLIIFDQRITHRGHSNITEVDKVLRSLRPSAPDGSDARVLVTVGFGLKRSKHLAGFKEGTLARQRDVFFVTERMFVALEVLLVLAAALLGHCLATRNWRAILSRRSVKYLCGSRYSPTSASESFKPFMLPTSPARVVAVQLEDEASTATLTQPVGRPSA